MASVLITGSNRGIGLEMARQYLKDGWRVFATCRHPEEAHELMDLAAFSNNQLTIHQLDVTHHDRVDHLAQTLEGESIEVLVNNAGTYGPKRMVFGSLDYAAWTDVMAVNTIAPVKMAEAFVEHLAAGRRKTIVNITSEMGSLANNTDGRHYLYRTSKAALNAATRSLAIDLADRGIIAVAVCPGWVRTDMGGPDAPLSPEESVAAIRALIEKLTPEHSGKFLSHDGTGISW